VWQIGEGGFTGDMVTRDNAFFDTGVFSLSSYQSFVVSHGYAWHRGGTISRTLFLRSNTTRGIGYQFVDSYGRVPQMPVKQPRGLPIGNVTYASNFTIMFEFVGGCSAYHQALHLPPCSSQCTVYFDSCMDNVAFITTPTDDYPNTRVLSLRPQVLSTPGYTNEQMQNVAFDDDCALNPVCTYNFGTHLFDCPPCAYGSSSVFQTQGTDLPYPKFFNDVWILDFWRPLSWQIVYITSHPILPFGAPSFSYALRIFGMESIAVLQAGRQTDFIPWDRLPAAGINDALYPFMGYYLCTYYVTSISDTSVRLQWLNNTSLTDLPKECVFQMRHVA
jgi:hypothetical protein